jgi:hypothetical protein
MGVIFVKHDEIQQLFSIIAYRHIQVKAGIGGNVPASAQKWCL